MNIVSVGEITLDHYLAQNQTHIGGISLNFAVNAKRSGAKHVSLISRVGSEDGQIILKKLEQENIDISHTQILPGKTACIDIEVQENADRIFPEGSYHANALANFRLSQEEINFIQKHNTLVTYFSTRQDSHFQQLKNIAFSGKRIVDFGDWSTRKNHFEELLCGLSNIDIAFISGTQKTIEKLLPYALDDLLIIVTLGETGSAALKNGKLHFQESIYVSNPIDATGCGDAFQGAFTVHYLKTTDLNASLIKGSQQAARVLQKFGAI